MHGPWAASNGVESFFSNFGRTLGMFHDVNVSYRTDDQFMNRNLASHVVEPRESGQRSSELVVTQRRRPSEKFRLRPCCRG